MRHSWTIKMNEKRKTKVERPNGSIIVVGNIKKCQYCSLMRGIQKSSGSYMSWHNTIYFDQDGKVLSEEKLPYPCTGKQANFLTKDDFYV